MTCMECGSIFLRPAEPARTGEGTSQWARRFACGGCGAVYVVRLTRIGTMQTDHQKAIAHHNPPPPAMVENGEAK